MRKANIELHIEKLILEGFPAGDRHRIGEALQLELARLIAGSGHTVAPGSNVSRPSVDAGSFPVTRTTRPDRVGADVARSVYRNLNLSGSPGKGGLK